MKKTIMVLAVFCGPLGAQTMVFQQAGAMAVGGPMVTTSMMGPMIPAGGPLVTGSPYSGTQTRHSLQVLGDGTRIERTDTTQVARDSAGRTRTEDEHTISIHDPVAGVSWMLDKARKTGNKMPGPAVRAGQELRNLQETTAAIVASNGVVSKSATKPVEEDLGTQVMNGVPAKGTRTTITIAAGEIGNDRDIHVVNERWYSETLQTVIKTSNSDPRFGTTEFDLNVTSQTEPDASLFQVPAGYTINEPQTMQFRTR